MSDVVQNLRNLEAAIRRAESDFGRESGSVRLIAVSKTISADGILPTLEAGHRRFGENYVQETAGKWPVLRERFPDAELHMIGPLQSNKAREAVALFDVLHSLDRASLASALAKEMDRSGRRPRLLVQVNTGKEPQKGGVLPRDVDAFLGQCRTAYGLEIEGLMCIPPAEDLPSPHFGLLASIARRNGLTALSMGMSADYEPAIQLGATHVRVGTAIFGARPPQA